MQTTPALPWDAEAGGTIQLAEPVTFADIVAGKIIITAETKDAHQQVTLTPTESEDDVFFMDGDNEVCSIAKFTSSSDSLVVTEGTQAENYMITGIRLGVPVREIEVFTNASATQRPVEGEQLKSVFVKINKNFGLNDGKTYGNEQGSDFETCKVETPSTEIPDDPYGVACYIDFASGALANPISKGDIIECIYSNEGYITIGNPLVVSFGDIVYV